MNDQCTRAQVLAGAIALSEATAAERDEYRRHISGCGRCLDSLGGEREIERVMSGVRDARETETWDPVPLRYQQPARTRGWQVAVFAVVTSIALAIVLQNAIGSSVQPPPVLPEDQFALQPVQISHVALTTRGAASKKPVAVVATVHHPVVPASMLVVHNVISRRGNRVTQTTVSTTEVAEAPVPRITAPPSNVPIWRRDEAMPRSTIAVAPTAVPVLSGHADSIYVAPIVRDVQPVGGDSAIAPRPGPIAYEEDAYGTTAFEVAVDERGVPVKCQITKSSGFGSLDQSVCRAAMKARYEPRSVNGRPTFGVYRDAFTFRPLGTDNTNDSN